MKIGVIAGTLLLVASVFYIVGYTVSETSRLAHEKDLATPSYLFTLAKESVVEKCKKDYQNEEVFRCDELRLFDMNNFYVEGAGQEQYSFVFTTSSKKISTNILYTVVVGEEDGVVVEITKTPLNVLDNGQPVN